MNCPNCNHEIPDEMLRVEIARRNGSVQSEKKAEAARENGKKGGRPRAPELRLELKERNRDSFLDAYGRQLLADVLRNKERLTEIHVTKLFLDYLLEENRIQKKEKYVVTFLGFPVKEVDMISGKNELYELIGNAGEVLNA